MLCLTFSSRNVDERGLHLSLNQIVTLPWFCEFVFVSLSSYRHNKVTSVCGTNEPGGFFLSLIGLFGFLACSSRLPLHGDVFKPFSCARGFFPSCQGTPRPPCARQTFGFHIIPQYLTFSSCAEHMVTSMNTWLTPQ